MNKVEVTIQTPHGSVTTVWEDDALVRLRLETDDRPESESIPEYASDLTERIHAYFRGEGDVLTGVCPVPEGSDFQMDVWAATVEVPYGETTSYGAVSHQLGLGSDGPRAVGTALNRNPLPLIVPCHRVVSSTGALTGFAPGLAWKRALLDLEMPQFSLALG